MNLLSRIEIPNYIKRVELSRPNQIKYYSKNHKVPKKYQGERFIFKNNYLVDRDTGKRIIKLSRSGKPKYHPIRGQEIWRGMNYHLRSKIAQEMKRYFYDQFKDITPIMDESLYPIGIRIDVYDFVNDGEDIDNMIYFYRKSIHDALGGNVSFKRVGSQVNKNGKKIQHLEPEYDKFPPIIIDDDKSHVQDIPTRFYPIEEGDIPRMVIEIYSLQ